MTTITSALPGMPVSEAVRPRSRGMLNARVAFVGSFIDPSKEALEAFVTEHGGKAQNFVSDKTTLVVVGNYHTPPAKLLRADELNQNGNNIRIMSLEDFLKETDELNNPLATVEAAEAVIIPAVVLPEHVEGEQVFETRRARRDHERMTEALAILKIDESTGRAYHGELPEKSVAEAQQDGSETASPVVFQTVSVASEKAPSAPRRERPAKRNNYNDIYAGFGERGAGWGFKLWMVPVLSLCVLIVALIVDSVVLTFVSVVATTSSITLLFIIYVIHRGLWKSDNNISS